MWYLERIFPLEVHTWWPRYEFMLHFIWCIQGVKKIKVLSDLHLYHYFLKIWYTNIMYKNLGCYISIWLARKKKLEMLYFSIFFSTYSSCCFSSFPSLTLCPLDSLAPQWQISHKIKEQTKINIAMLSTYWWIFLAQGIKMKSKNFYSNPSFISNLLIVIFDLSQKASYD